MWFTGSDPSGTVLAGVSVPLSWRRDLAGMEHQFRIEALGQHVAEHGPLAVRDSRSGCFHDRHRMWLDDGSVLELKLFWPRRVVVAALVSVRFKDSVGWIVRVRSTAGEPVHLAAWLARLYPERPHLQRV
jgi:hypothetical protein